MLTTLASIVSGVIGVGIILIGARFLLAPRMAAAGFGVAAEPPGTQAQAASPYAWLYAKGVRDIASGIFIWVLLANRAPHLLGAFMAAASIVPVGDAMIVLRSGGSARRPLASTAPLRRSPSPRAPRCSWPECCFMGAMGATQSATDRQSLPGCCHLWSPAHHRDPGRCCPVEPAPHRPVPMRSTSCLTVGTKPFE